MSFGDLKSLAGLKAINDYLTDKSYIEGFQASQADTAVFNALSGAPGSAYPHALRWFNHIKSYGNDRNKFPGVAKSAADFGITNGTVEKGAAKDAQKGDADDDDLDLFGSDNEEDDEAERVKQERLKAYQEKKAKKPGVIAKSSVILDVKPWDDETDMKLMETNVRTIECDGLKWGVSKFVPLAYGINKLQIVCVVEDEKVSIDWLQEEIEKFEDVVQSVDIAAFQKI